MMRVLNVTDKNDSARNIATILSRGTAQNIDGIDKSDRIYAFQTCVPQLGGQCDMIMTSVKGHLLDMDFDVKLRRWHSCDPYQLFDAPIQEKLSPNNKDGHQIKSTLEHEAKCSQALIIWTSSDREGENIGFEIIRVCLRVQPNLRVLRAKFSEITQTAMNTAIRSLVEPDKNLSEAVDVRRELDLRSGAIFTRYQSLLLRFADHPNQIKRVFSYGPCQFPTMGFVINRYLKIINFTPQSFWSISVSYKWDNSEVLFNWKRHRLFEEHACLALYSRIMECPKARVDDIVERKKLCCRPLPMNTTLMQRLASSKLSIPARDALSIAENLYSQGYISYPRTESNIFPKGLNLSEIVGRQTTHPMWGGFAQEIMKNGGPDPRSGEKSDNAHPPIHPTRPGHGLTGREQQIYGLIARHFLACVSRDALGVETTVNINLRGEQFSTRSSVVLKSNFLEVYPYSRWSAKEIPKFNVNEEFIPDSILMKEGVTSAPQLLTESDLIALMEKHGIGTDSTHAEHIYRIRRREYVKVLASKRFCPTKIGLALYDGYHQMKFTHLIEPVLRSRLERDLGKIAESTKDSRQVTCQYIDEYRNIYHKIREERQKLVDAFVFNINKEEPEIVLRHLHPPSEDVEMLSSC